MVLALHILICISNDIVCISCNVGFQFELLIAEQFLSPGVRRVILLRVRVLLVGHDQTCEFASRIARRFVVIALVELDSHCSFLFRGVMRTILMTARLLTYRGAVLRKDHLWARTSIIVWVFSQITVITVQVGQRVAIRAKVDSGRLRAY